MLTGENISSSDTLPGFKSSFLSKEEYLRIHDNPLLIVQKAEEYIEKKEEELLEAREEIKAYKLSSETQLNSFEQKQQAIREENERLLKRIDEYKEEFKSYMDQMEQLKSQIKESEKRYHEQRLEIEKINQVNEDLKSEKNRFLITAEKKDKELEDLNSRIETLNEKLNEQYKIKRELEEKVQSTESSQLPLKYENEKLKHEKELIEQQNNWLNSELSSRQEQIVKLKSETSIKINDLQNQCSTKDDTINHLNDKVKALEKLNKEYLTNVQQKIEEIRDLKNVHIQQIDNLNEELMNERRLLDMNNNHVSDLEDRIKELEKSLNLTRESKNRLEKGFENEREEFKVQIRQLKEKIEDLEEIISKHDRSIEQNLELKASSLIAQGVSTSDIYSKFVKVSEDLLKTKNENKKLNETLDNILKNLEEKAPIIQSQREEYEHLRSQYTILTKQRQDVLQENEKLKVEFKHLTEENSSLKKRLYVSEQLCSDLSNQVKELLKESISDRTAESSTEVIDGGAIISQRLVSFGNIDELQQRNLELLRTIRELTKEKEEETKSLQEALASDFKEKFHQALKQIEELKRESHRQMEKTQSIIKQRDMLRMLLDEQEKSNETNTSNTHNKSQSNNDQERNDFTQLKEIRELQQEYIKDRKLLQEEISIKGEQVSKLQSHVARLTSELEFTKETAKTTNLAYESAKRELDRIRTLNDQLTKTVDSLQKNLEVSRISSEEKFDKIKRLEHEIIQLKSDKLYLEQRNERLLNEIEVTKKDVSRQEEFYSSLQKIQFSLENRDVEERKKISKDIEYYKAEITELKKKLEDEGILARERKLQLDLSDADFKERLENKQQEIYKLKEEITRLQSTCEHEMEKNTSLHQKLASAEDRLNKILEKQLLGNTSSNETVTASTNLSELQLQFTKIQNENEYLKESLETERSKVANLKEVVESNDKTMKEMSESYDKYKTTLETKITALNQQIIDLQQQLKETQQKLISKSEEYDQLKQHLNEINENANKEKQFTQTISEENKLNTESFEKRIEILREDLRRHIQLWKDAQDKYEQELIRHAETIEALKRKKEEFNNLSVQHEISTSAAKHLELETEKKVESLRTQNELLSKQREEDEKRIKELERQLELTHSRVETLSIQLKKAQTSTDTSIEHVPMDQSQEILGLQETVSFLRREKESMKTKFAITEQELKNTKQKLEHTYKELAQVQTELKSEREKNQKKNKEYDETEQFISELQEQVKVFKESNKTLRQQNDQTLQLLETSRQEANEARTQLIPLNQRIAELQKEKDMNDEEIKILKEDVLKWQNKVQQLMQKYKQIDPEVHENLLQDLEQAQKSKQELEDQYKKQLEEKNEIIKRLKAESEEFTSRKDKMLEIMRSQKEKNQTLKIENEKLQQKVDTLEQEVKHYKEDKKKNEEDKKKNEEEKKKKDEEEEKKKKEEDRKRRVEEMKSLALKSMMAKSTNNAPPISSETSTTPLTTPPIPVVTPTSIEEPKVTGKRTMDEYEEEQQQEEEISTDVPIASSSTTTTVTVTEEHVVTSSSDKDRPIKKVRSEDEEKDDDSHLSTDKQSGKGRFKRPPIGKNNKEEKGEEDVESTSGDKEDEEK
ncbi:hypothetical protein ABK040_012922 [Willaertia magna]